MKSIFTLENKWISFFSYAGICLATVYLLLYIAPINTNDDVYIYFNFAKNFAQGNFFSMDSRGLPVDACTGILYLILLVPFELLQVNPMFWGFMLNVLAFLGSSFIFSRILFFFFSDKLVSLFGFLSFVLLNVLQDRLIGIIGWSFETWFSPFFLFLLSYFTLFYDHKKLTFPIGFSLIYISGVLVRPENILLYSPVFLLLFLKQKNPSLLIIKTVISLSVLLILLFSIKYLIFNDFFPLGTTENSQAI